MVVVRVVVAIFLGLPFGAEAALREVRFKDAPLEIREGDRLVISGIRGSVRLIPLAMGRTPVLRAKKIMAEKFAATAGERFDALNYQVRRGDGVLVIEARGPASKAEWGEWLKPGGPELVLEIEAPAVPVEVSLHSGLITTQNWKGPLSTTLVEGVVRTSATEGPLRLQVQKGEARVDSHRGRLEFDTYGARLNAQNVDGELMVENFSGETSLSQIKGNIQLRSHAGGSSIAKSTGALDFELGRGGLTVTGFEGPLRGQTANGSVVAALEGEAEVAIESVQGPVTVKLPGESAAFVRLQSETGSLSAPEPVRPGQAGTLKTAVGRLGGSGPRGTVVIRSKAASLRVR